MALFINTTETIGIVMANATNYTFGTMFMSLFAVVMLILAVAIMFNIRLEFTAILILPLMLSYMAFYGEFIAIGCVLLAYLAIIVTKNFLFR